MHATYSVLFYRPGSSSQPIWLQFFSCESYSGSCLDICTSCPSRSITNCTHNRDVTVQCSESRRLNFCTAWSHFLCVYVRSGIKQLILSFCLSFPLSGTFTGVKGMCNYSNLKKTITLFFRTIILNLNVLSKQGKGLHRVRHMVS